MPEISMVGKPAVVRRSSSLATSEGWRMPRPHSTCASDAAEYLYEESEVAYEPAFQGHSAMCRPPDRQPHTYRAKCIDTAAAQGHCKALKA